MIRQSYSGTGQRGFHKPSPHHATKELIHWASWSKVDQMTYEISSNSLISTEKPFSFNTSSNIWINSNHTDIPQTRFHSNFLRIRLLRTILVTVWSNHSNSLEQRVMLIPYPQACLWWINEKTSLLALTTCPVTGVFLFWYQRQLITSWIFLLSLPSLILPLSLTSLSFYYPRLLSQATLHNSMPQR